MNYSSSLFFYLFFYLYFICTLSLSVPPFCLLLALSSFLSLFFSSSFSLFLSLSIFLFIYLSISPCPLLSLCPTVSLSHKYNNIKLVCLSVCLFVYLSFVAFSLFLYPFRFVLQVRVFSLARRWMIILLCWNTPLLWPVR